MSAVETEIINKSKIKPLEWKRYIDDVFSLWDTEREEIDQFILEANRHHPTITLPQNRAFRCVGDHTRQFGPWPTRNRPALPGAAARVVRIVLFGGKML